MELDYYGDNIDVIHLKWGNALKMYNFTDAFKEKYPVFVAEYLRYWDNPSNGMNRFHNAYTLLKYIKDFSIPVHLYFNFTDTPCTVDEALEWWFDNNTISDSLDK